MRDEYDEAELMAEVEAEVEDQAEVDKAIHDAYVAPDGQVRNHADALEAFEPILADAIQAHRGWAMDLEREFLRRGMRTWLIGRRKNSKFFEFVDRGRKKKRSVNRGVVRSDDEGVARWTQLELWSWTADDLHAAIAQASRNIEENRANISLYRDMIDLLDQTEAFTFEQALGVVGLTWGQWLASREDRSA